MGNSKKCLKNFNHRKCLSIGNELINGPLAIFPGDDNGWLECDLKIIQKSADYEKQKSITLFTDDTMNKSEGYYEPVLRFCSWNRKDDMNGERDWPSQSEIKLGRLQDENMFSEKFIEFQKLISNFYFIPHCINHNRSTVEAECDVYSPTFEIYIRNGVQALTINSMSLKNDEFTIQVHSMFSFMVKQLKQFSHQGWKERYETDLVNNYPQKMWNMQL